MLCVYTVNYGDFKAAQRLHIRGSLKNRLVFLIFQRIMPGLAVIAAGILVWAIRFQHFSLSPWLGFVLAAVVWLGVCCPVMRLVQFRRGYKAMKNGRDENAPLELEWTESELISRVPGRGEGRLLPAGIQQFAEDDQVGMIYLSAKRFLVLPRRMMPAENWADLRQWLRSRKVRQLC